MKRILFTNLFFKGFTGTELVTLSQANYFLNKGYDVDIFTLEFGSPLKEHISEKIRVVTLGNIDELYEKYDVMIGRHYPLVDYLLFTRGIQPERIYSECCSYWLPIEAYPIYYKNLTLCGVVSSKIINELSSKGYDTSDVYLMPNSATDEYFNTTWQGDGTLKKIAIVSNHPQTELKQFKEFAENEGDFQVDIYGMHHKYELVTPELLSEYDLIISVAKTIYYALAIGIPAYTYDESCTVGYITCDNYKENLNNNFDNDTEFKKKTAKELFNDITSNYQSAFNDRDELKSYARTDFSFNNLMDDLIDRIEALPPINYDSLYREYPTLKYSSRVYVEDRDFLLKENKKWYEKSLELGDLYQSEIKKTVNALTKLDKLNKEHAKVINSRGWIALEKLRNIKKALHL